MHGHMNVRFAVMCRRCGVLYGLVRHTIYTLPILWFKTHNITVPVIALHTPYNLNSTILIISLP